MDALEFRLAFARTLATGAYDYCMLQPNAIIEITTSFLATNIIRILRHIYQYTCSVAVLLQIMLILFCAIFIRYAYAVSAFIDFPMISPDIREKVNTLCANDLRQCSNSLFQYPKISSTQDVTATCQKLFGTIFSSVYGDSNDGAVNIYGVQNECFDNMCPGPQQYMFRGYIRDIILNRLQTIQDSIVDTIHIDDKRKSPDLSSKYDYTKVRSVFPCLDSSLLSAFMNDPQVLFDIFRFVMLL